MAEVGETEEADKKKLTRIPGPKRVPLFGNLFKLAGDDMLYVKLDKLRQDYGDVVYFELGSLKMLTVFGQDKVRKLLTDSKDRFKYRPAYLIEVKSLELFKGIVWSNDKETDKRRDFASDSVNIGVGPVSLEQRIQTEAEAIVKELKGTKGNSTVLKRAFYQAICNINCAIIFGSRYEYTDPEFQELIELMDLLLQKGGVKNLRNFFPILQKLPDTKQTQFTRSVLQKVQAFIHSKIEQARPKLDKDNPASLVDLYLCQEKNDNSVTEDELCHMVRDFFVAGTENVAIGLNWLVGYMVQYDDVQRQCRNIIQQKVPDRTVTNLEDVNNMPYIEATINEVLRKANIAPLSVPHCTMVETDFEGYIIPAKTMILTHLVSVHNDTRYWDSPEQFNPDRFLQDGQLVKKEAFYPYSIGARYCVAAKLSQMELQIIFSTLLKHVQFSRDFDSATPLLQSSQPGAFQEPVPFNLKWEPV